MRVASAVVRPTRKVCTRFQLVATVPGFRRQLKNGQGFKLIGLSGPGAKEVATPPLGCDHHVLGPLAIGIAVESSVSKDGTEKSSRAELVAVADTDRHAFLTIVRR